MYIPLTNVGSRRRTQHAGRAANIRVVSVKGCLLSEAPSQLLQSLLLLPSSFLLLL